MDETRVMKEHKRLEALLSKADVPKQKRDVLAPVIDNLAWQRIKLDETRELMQNTAVVIPYNNGGGQEGLRENPIFKAYINLFRAYMVGLEKFSEYLPEDLQGEAGGDGMSVLAQVMEMKKKA